MANSILTERQQLLLNLLFSEQDINSRFYLSGGTALAEYYLHHRYSEDLDFFSNEEVAPFSIQVLLKKLSNKLGIKKIDFQQSYNRNLYFLHFNDEIIKTEFTYYPFSQINLPKKINSIIIDSLLDIAVNKAFTIYQTPRSRDFIDLFLIMENEQWTFTDLLKKARIKFDTHIDPIQLGQQLLQVIELKDYPRMIEQLSDNVWQEFWLTELKKLKNYALK